MKMTTKFTAFIIAAFILLVSCTPIRPVGGLKIATTGHCYVPVTEMQMSKINMAANSDLGRPSNAAAAMQIANTAFDGRADWYVSNGNYLKEIPVQADFNGDGRPDPFFDPQGQPSFEGVVEYSRFINVANGSTITPTYNIGGVSCYYATYIIYTFPCAYTSAADQSGMFDQYNGLKYFMEIRL